MPPRREPSRLALVADHQAGVARGWDRPSSLNGGRRCLLRVPVAVLGDDRSLHNVRTGADPAQIKDQVTSLSDALPADAQKLLIEQVGTSTSTPQQSLGIGLVVSLLVSLWSASGGVGYLISPVNVAYDEEENRGFVKRKLLTLALTIGAIVFVLVGLVGKH